MLLAHLATPTTAYLAGDIAAPSLKTVVVYLTAVGTAVKLKVAPSLPPSGLTRRGVAGVPAARIPEC